MRERQSTRRCNQAAVWPVGECRYSALDFSSIPQIYNGQLNT
jgi:hypothetical protein